VTDDHSLITKDGCEISPKDICIGTELLHHTILNENVNFIESRMNVEEATILGFFFGDGGNKNPKIIPKEILLSNNKEIKNAFWDGMCDAIFWDGMCNDNGSIKIGSVIIICQTNQISSAQIAWLVSSLGYNVSLNTKNDKTYILRIIMLSDDNDSTTINTNEIKKITELPLYKGYVYDLTTDNHHFAAGVGNMIVHNTDSVFFTFSLKEPETGEKIIGQKALEISIEIAQEACHLVSKFLKQPHDFEYEKTFFPFLLLSKKRYVGMMYETDPKKCKRKEMGIVLKRRDNAPIVKDVYGGVIDILMKEQNINKAVEFLDTCLTNITQEKFPIEKLIITKSLNSTYKKPNQIAHKVLADRMTSRDPGNKPSVGDRIPFVYIHTKNKKALQGEKIETPTFIKENNLKIDYAFYITNQIMKPIQQVFALVLEKIWIENKKISRLKNFQKEVEKIRTFCDEDKVEEKIEKLKNDEIKILLFDKYIRSSENIKNSNQSMMKFVTKQN
jgi:hypothetical protein